MKYSLYNDDCLIKLKDLEDNSIDSCITDPPYGLSFMGHKWDYDVPKIEIWKEVYRVLKPGGYCLSFFGTRTYHRGVINIEDAGFEIRDQIMWIYGSGFPKSFNIDKAITKQLNIDSSEYKGLGTALKPAHEPIVMARKPISETSIVKNIVKHGTGAINIDDCRVPVDGEYVIPSIREYNHNMEGWSRPWQKNYELVKNKQEEAYNKLNNIGRFPANVIHDGSEEVINNFPDAKGQSGKLNERIYDKSTGIYGKYKYKSGSVPRNDSSKNASRFFYCAKSSKHDRDEGLTIEERAIVTFQTKNGTSGVASSLSKDRNTSYKNIHPTVKPQTLMKYLCRLVTPRNGIILDPFMGSGSTGKAAGLEGFKFVGIELNEEYFKIAEQRVKIGYKND